MAESWFWHNNNNNNGSFWQHFKFRLQPPGRWTEISLDMSFKLRQYWSFWHSGHSSVFVWFTSQKSLRHWKGCWRDCSGLRKHARGRRSRRNVWSCPHHDCPNCYASTSTSKRVGHQRTRGACEPPSWIALWRSPWSPGLMERNTERSHCLHSEKIDCKNQFF